MIINIKIHKLFVTLSRHLLILAFLVSPAFTTFALAGPNLKVLYIRAEFSDKSMGINQGTWKNRLVTLNARLEGYWKKHSYTAINSIAATYTPIYTFPQPFKNYHNVDTLRVAIRDIASKGGYSVSSYDHVIYSYPNIPHNISFGALGSPGNIWLPGSNPFDGGLIHEFGHALGVGHAHSIEGAAGVTFPGAAREGRDGLFMMGSDSGGRIGDYSTINLPMRYDMGFVGDKYITQVKKNGTYRIWEFELNKLPSTRPLAARVTVSGQQFWLSFAPTMVGRWANYNSAGFGKGVIIHRYTPRAPGRFGVTSILDFTPGSFKGTKNEEDYKDIRDGALQVGRSYAFPNSSVSISPIKTGKAKGIRYIDVEIKTGVNAPSGNTSVTPPSGYTLLEYRHSAKCFDLAGGKLTNGATYHQWGCNPSNQNQKFKFESVGNGFYNIRVQRSGLCLDLAFGSNNNGAKLHQYSCSKTNSNQHWKIVGKDSGYFELRARKSDKCASVKNVSTANGAAIHQWQCINSKAQQLRFK